MRLRHGLPLHERLPRGPHGPHVRADGGADVQPDDASSHCVPDISADADAYKHADDESNGKPEREPDMESVDVAKYKPQLSAECITNREPEREPDCCAHELAVYVAHGQPEREPHDRAHSRAHVACVRPANH